MSATLKVLIKEMPNQCVIFITAISVFSVVAVPPFPFQGTQKAANYFCGVH